MNILIVEDELLIRMDLENRLKRLGAGVIGSTATGEKAVELAVELKPDIILMDIKLQGPMDGIDSARQILALTDCRIVFISAFDRPDLPARLFPKTAQVSYVSKPLATSQLEAILRG